MQDDNKLPSCSIYSPYVAPGEGAPIGGIQKRIFDVVAASLIIIILLPIFGLIALAIKLCDGGDIFYGHRRIGHNGKPFFCFKFRTMVPDSDQRLAAYLQSDPVARAEWASCRKLRHDGRVTGIGYVLRKLSLDELPQLLNVIRGEMSLVGPRPIVREEIYLYGESSQYYLRSRPGITGAWQASGRSDISYDQRVKIDRHYVEHWTFTRDLMIILKTVPVVLSARGSW
jgi:exopolysaccharide production protein ExoY